MALEKATRGRMASFGAITQFVGGAAAMLCAATLALSTPARAEWVPVVEWEGGANYVDGSALSSRPQTGVKSFQLLSNYEKPNRSMVLDQEIDCDRMAFRYLRIRHHMSTMGAGPVQAREDNPDASWAPIRPESNAQAFYAAVCGKK